jgi:hypothetical protein
VPQLSLHDRTKHICVAPIKEELCPMPVGGNTLRFRKPARYRRVWDVYWHALLLVINMKMVHRPMDDGGEDQARGDQEHDAREEGVAPSE